MDVTTIAAYLQDHPPQETIEVVESAWSCAHGVERWKQDCGCSTGGLPGWNQRWRAPLRAALDLVRDAVDEVFERRGAAVLRDPWAARDDYVRVLLGAVTKAEFAERHVTGGEVEAFTLLEAERHAMAMYTSCGWFFNDLAGLETVQVLRYAARAMDCLFELGETPPIGTFQDVIAQAESNQASEGNGRDVWERHVEPARVDAERAVAHLALVELLEGRKPASRLGVFDIEIIDHGHRERGAVSMSWGAVTLTHRRTGRSSSHVYAAIHLGGLEVLGATRLADEGRDAQDLSALQDALDADAPVTTLLRLVADRFGPHEFGLHSALPDAAEQFLESAANALADRFAREYDRLFSDNRATLAALAVAGYQLPAELRAPAELALARRLEHEVAAQAGSLEPDDYLGAAAIAREAQASGVSLDAPAARLEIERLILLAVERAIAEPSQAHIGAVTRALALARELGLDLGVGRAQELVHEAVALGAADELRPLAEALGLVV
jgi:hypothetical protein